MQLIQSLYHILSSCNLCVEKSDPVAQSVCRDTVSLLRFLPAKINSGKFNIALLINPIQVTAFSIALFINPIQVTAFNIALLINPIQVTAFSILSILSVSVAVVQFCLGVAAATSDDQLHTKDADFGCYWSYYDSIRPAGIHFGNYRSTPYPFIPFVTNGWVG